MTRRFCARVCVGDGRLPAGFESQRPCGVAGLVAPKKYRTPRRGKRVILREREQREQRGERGREVVPFFRLLEVPDFGDGDAFLCFFFGAFAREDMIASHRVEAMQASG